MTSGRLIAVVGPSGVGKDSVMAGLAQAAPDLSLVRRAITRDPELGGEDYEPLTDAAFDAALAEGAFCLHWGAHGLRYGIPKATLCHVQSGGQALANLSRKALPEAAQVFPNLTVLNITAAPDTIAARLAARGREDAAGIARRRAVADKPLPDHLHILHIANDGALDDTIAAALAALRHPLTEIAS